MGVRIGVDWGIEEGKRCNGGEGTGDDGGRGEEKLGWYEKESWG